MSSQLAARAGPEGRFQHKAFEMGIESEYSLQVLSHLGDSFTLEELKRAIAAVGNREPKLAQTHSYAHDNLIWLGLSNYEIEFAPDIPMSARVVFPNSPQEQNGIEDARFVRFTDDDGSVIYYATYTAYSGRAILPQLLETKDFLRFRIVTLSGRAIENKGLALFPRKIDGEYFVISRQDGENIYIMHSEDIEVWREKIPLARPTRAEAGMRPRPNAHLTAPRRLPIRRASRPRRVSRLAEPDATRPRRAVHPLTGRQQGRLPGRDGFGGTAGKEP